MEGVKEGYHDDILNIMLQYEKKNPNYEIEQQVDDFLTFFIAGFESLMTHFGMILVDFIPAQLNFLYKIF